MISILTTRRVASVFSAVALCAVMAGCSLEGQPAPALTGPSEFGLSVIASAIPDQLLRDGASQTVVTMTTRGADGSPMAGQSIAIALASAGSGTVSPHLVKLSADLVTSDANGRATFAITAPPSTSTGDLIIVQMRAVGTDASNTAPRNFQVGVYPSNPNPPNASFVVLPEAPLVNELVVFDASQSTDEGLDCQLTCTFTWDFGDGSSGSGVTVTHRYTSPGGKVVRLTVADANGATTTLARTITVTAVAPPTVTVSPNPPIVTQSAAFTTVVAAGIVPTKYTWSWGDGSADTESTSGLATHTYAAVGSYTVTVTVEDSLGGTPTVGILSFTVIPVPVP